MLKRFKKMFVSIFILIFNSACFFSPLTSFATPVDPDAFYFYGLSHPEQQDDLAKRLFRFCGITREDLLATPELQNYTSMCQNLFNLIHSQEDYEEMHALLDSSSLCLFERDLGEIFDFSGYDDIMSQYREALEQHISYDSYLYLKTELDLFDAIFIYSYILNTPGIEEYIPEMKNALRKNGINPSNFTLFDPSLTSYEHSDLESGYVYTLDLDNSSLVYDWDADPVEDGFIDSKDFRYSKYNRKHSQRQKRNKNESQQVITQYQRAGKAELNGHHFHPGFKRLKSRVKKS